MMSKKFVIRIRRFGKLGTEGNEVFLEISTKNYSEKTKKIQLLDFDTMKNAYFFMQN